jgi:glutathionylspermidine synthase
MDEITQIENATIELWQMCLKAVQYVIDKNLYSLFDIPSFIIPEIETSWNRTILPYTAGSVYATRKDN